MAREIARRFEADIIKLSADSYTLDFNGWINANIDAWNHNPAVIAPETIDISNYNLIILGSPIWYFRPAPPLWTFVEKIISMARPSFSSTPSTADLNQNRYKSFNS
jgi:hypothetical protein